MCCAFACSDEAATGKYENPFMKRPNMGFLQWAMLYCSIPIAWFIAFKHYYKHDYDVNCIKKHPSYMTGKLVGRICKPISLRLAKIEAKKMNITFNDLVLGMVSKAFKQYFVAKGDDSKYITASVPFSLEAIPDQIEEYTATNNFASLILYLDLEDDFGTACSKVKKTMDWMKKSLLPFGTATMVDFYSWAFP